MFLFFFSFFFPSCEWAHVTRREFASLPNLCSGERAVVRFESALEKDSEEGGQEEGGACHDVTSPAPHSPLLLTHPSASPPPSSSSCLNGRIIHRER